MLWGLRNYISLERSDDPRVSAHLVPELYGAHSLVMKCIPSQKTRHFKDEAQPALFKGPVRTAL
jgi:hypothetical protein